MTWNVITRYAAPAPWEGVEWPEHLLNELDFWLWLSRTHGRVRAERAWADYNDAETWDEALWDEPGWRPTKRFEGAFNGLAGAIENWMWATLQDERHAVRVLRLENERKRAKIRWDLFWIVRVLMRCRFRGEVILESGYAVMAVVDMFMTQRGLVKAEDVWEVPPTAGQMDSAVAMVSLAWKVLNLDDAEYEQLRAGAAA